MPRGRAKCVRLRWPTSPKWTVASRGPDVSNWIGHAKCARSRWPTSPKWTKASRGPDVSNWIGHAKCARSRWPTSPKWTKASRDPDVSNWIGHAKCRSCQVCKVKMADITEVDKAEDLMFQTDVRGHAKCVRSRWPTSPKWTKASRGPDVSNWIGHAKWCEVKLADITEVDGG
eukprot:Em0691g1a